MNSNALNLALKQASRKLSVDARLVESVYRSYWKFVHDYINNIGSVTELSKEEFDSIDKNFNIPYIGKLYMDYDKLQKYKRRLKNYQDVKAKESEANRLSGTCD